MNSLITLYCSKHPSPITVPNLTWNCDFLNWMNQILLKCRIPHCRSGEGPERLQFYQTPRCAEAAGRGWGATSGVNDINCTLPLFLFSHVVIEKTWALEQMDGVWIPPLSLPSLVKLDWFFVCEMGTWYLPSKFLVQMTWEDVWRHVALRECSTKISCIRVT